MLSLLKKPRALRSRTVEVGWLLDAEKAGFIWSAPQKLTRDDPKARHAKSVRYCPAVLDHEARLFEVTCPIDLHPGLFSALYMARSESIASTPPTAMR